MKAMKFSEPVVVELSVEGYAYGFKAAPLGLALELDAAQAALAGEATDETAKRFAEALAGCLAGMTVRGSAERLFETLDLGQLVEVLVAVREGLAEANPFEQ